ncbi:golgin subfamily A member 6-like protein 22 [Scomber scombrus]|uniref:Golgin subfamily A member 6-like protein 22 n=1 Tax=Scomber scombrus TaxID=13677 RepID=A0AAV1QBU5_SCOSC
MESKEDKRVCERMKGIMNPIKNLILSEKAEFLTWAVEVQLRKHESDRTVWEKDTSSRIIQIESLEAKILHLQDKQEAHKKEMEDLREELEASKKLIDVQSKKDKCKNEQKDQTHKHLFDAMKRHYEREIKKLKEQRKQDAENASKVEAGLHQSQSRHDEKIQTIEKQHHSSLGKVQVENKKLQAENEKLQAEVENLQNVSSKREQETKDISAKFNTVYKEYREKLEKQRVELTEDKTRRETKCTELYMTVHKQTKQIQVLEQRRDLTVPLKRAEEAIKKHLDLIEKKNQEIVTLKREKKEAIEKYADQMNKNALQTASLDESHRKYAGLEKDLESEHASHKETKVELCLSNRTISDIKDDIEDLRNKVAVSEPECTRLKAEVIHLNNLQLRLKEGIQTCLSAMDKPKLLRTRLINLKRRHMDGDESVKMPDSTREAYEYQARCYKRKVAALEGNNKTLSSQLRHTEKRIQSNAIRGHNMRVSLLKVINEQARKQQASQQMDKTPRLPSIEARKTPQRTDITPPHEQKS